MKVLFKHDDNNNYVVVDFVQYIKMNRDECRLIIETKENTATINFTPEESEDREYKLDRAQGKLHNLFHNYIIRDIKMNVPLIDIPALMEEMKNHEDK